MIGDWRGDDAEDLFNGGRGHRSWQSFSRVARRKLLMLEAARTLDDLRNPPGNRLEPLTGSRRGQHSSRMNEQYRIYFVWRDGRAFDIEITDYHDE